MNFGFDQIGMADFCGSKIDLDCLPGACLVLHRDLDANGIGLLHVAGLSFDPECELIEADFQNFG